RGRIFPTERLPEMIRPADAQPSRDRGGATSLTRRNFSPDSGIVVALLIFPPDHKACEIGRVKSSSRKSQNFCAAASRKAPRKAFPEIVGISITSPLVDMYRSRRRYVIVPNVLSPCEIGVWAVKSSSVLLMIFL